jgi:hypothetical protein
MRKIPLRGLSAASIIVFVFCGCGDRHAQDPYPRATLRTLTRGKPVPSPGFRYKLANPRIDAVYRNLGLVREGNLVEFIAGRNLEERLSGVSSGNYALAVAKEFSPFVHFRVERIYTESDTTFLTPGPVALPSVVDAAGFDASAYERIDLDGIYYNRTDILKGLENRKLRITCPLVSEEKGEEGSYFVLHGKNAKFRVAPPSDGIGLILKLLTEKGYAFEGGVVLISLEDLEPRMNSKIAGTVEVDFVKYGRRIVSD